MHHVNRDRRAFTLIELLVVIAIIAILSVVVVLTLNPAQLLMQSRDSDRVSDMSTLNSALGIYSAQGGLSLGNSNVVYVSIPDPSATSTAGDQCQGLGLISLPAGYSYFCAASSTYRNTNGTGWVPVNFASMAAGSPLSILPIDPAQSSSSRLYYTYTTNGSQYELTSDMESAKYQLGGSNDVIGTDGGTLASVYEKGSKLGLEPLDYGDASLVGLWTLNEGMGTIAYDYSGNNATGSWQGTLGSQWAAGKVGTYAGQFNPVNTSTANWVAVNYVPALSPTTAITIAAWYQITNNTYGQSIVNQIQTGGTNAWGLYYKNSTQLQVSVGGVASPVVTGSSTIGNGTWHYVIATYNGSSINVYFDGQLLSTTNAAGSIATLTNSIAIGYASNGGLGFAQPYFSGLIDDVRIYNRALAAAQIAAMYAGGK